NLAEFAAQLGPRIARISRDIQVPVQAVGDDDVRIRPMRAEPIDHRIRLDRQRAFLPGRPAVARTLNRSALAGDKVAVANEDGVPIVGLDRDAAAIGNRIALGEAWEAVQGEGLALVSA